MKILWTDNIITIGIMPIGKYYDTDAEKNVYLDHEIGVISSPYFADEIPVSWAKYASKKLKTGNDTILKCL